MTRRDVESCFNVHDTCTLDVKDLAGDEQVNTSSKVPPLPSPAIFHHIAPNTNRPVVFDAATPENPTTQSSAYLPKMASISTTSVVRYKFIFFTPPKHLSEIKAAIFATGAGTFPNYSECCFTTSGRGQFRPSGSASPAIGARGQLEELEEVRCEMICNGREITERAVAALKK